MSTRPNKRDERMEVRVRSQGLSSPVPLEFGGRGECLSSSSARLQAPFAAILGRDEVGFPGWRLSNRLGHHRMPSPRLVRCYRFGQDNIAPLNSVVHFIIRDADAGPRHGGPYSFQARWDVASSSTQSDSSHVMPFRPGTFRVGPDL